MITTMMSGMQEGSIGKGNFIRLGVWERGTGWTLKNRHTACLQKEKKTVNQKNPNRR